MRTAVACFVTYNVYLFGHLVRIRLEVIVQNDRGFMEVILLCNVQGPDRYWYN